MKDQGKFSDNDFDALFKEKLSSLEIKPTGKVWKGISEQLHNGKRKRNFPVLWIAAASMAAIIGVGFWLSSTKEPMQLTGTTGLKPNTELPATVEKDIAKKIEVLPLEEKREYKIKLVRTKPVKKSTEISKSRTFEPNDMNRPSVAKIGEKELEASAKIDQEKTDIQSLTNVKEDLPVLAQVPDADVVEEPRQKRIKSVGSLVNFVVGKVDKRKNKIIEFEDDDEGTRVSGLNLGVLKFQAKETK